MQLYTENEKKKKKLQLYYQLLALTRNNIALYKNCVYYKHETNLMRCSDYFKKQYYAFRNQVGDLVPYKYVICEYM